MIKIIAEKDYYIDTPSTFYLFTDSGSVNREELKKTFRKRVVVLDRSSFREMRILLFPDILKSGVFIRESKTLV